MPGLVHNATNVTLQQLMSVGNSSGNMAEFFISVNNTIFNGYLWFILLWLIWVIMVIVSQKVKDQPLNNAMYGGATVTVLSFFIRGVTMLVNGVRQGLLSDHQMWIFPVLTMLIALIVYATKDN